MWAVIGAIVLASMSLAFFLVKKTQSLQSVFLVGFNTLLPVVVCMAFFLEGAFLRTGVIIGMVVIYVFRLNWVLIKWYHFTGAVKLNTSLSAHERMAVPIILVLTIAFVYPIPFHYGLTNSSDMGLFDGVAVFLYIVGSYIHLRSDLEKKRFKENPENNGKLLRTGLWRFSRHPNYFGDFLIYLSWAFIGHSLVGFISPLANFLQYRFDAIPKNEKYACEVYGEEWREYKKRTKCIIPFIY